MPSGHCRNVVTMLLHCKVDVMNKIQLNLNQSTILSFKKMHLKVSNGGHFFHSSIC